MDIETRVGVAATPSNGKIYYYLMVYFDKIPEDARFVKLHGWPQKGTFSAEFSAVGGPEYYTLHQNKYSKVYHVKKSIDKIKGLEGYDKAHKAVRVANVSYHDDTLIFGRFNPSDWVVNEKKSRRGVKDAASPENTVQDAVKIVIQGLNQDSAAQLVSEMSPKIWELGGTIHKGK